MTKLKTNIKTDQDVSILKLEALRNGTVYEITKFLISISKLYHYVSVYDTYLYNASRNTSSKIKINYLNQLISHDKKFYEHLDHDYEFRIKSIVIQSPGIWEFLGNLSPLKFIRDILNDKHERKKDNRYRNREEEYMLSIMNEQRKLKNEKLRIKNEHDEIMNLILLNDKLKLDIEMMRELNYPEEKIKEITQKFYINPSIKLRQFSEYNLIGSASIRLQ